MQDLIILTEFGLYCKEGDFYIDAWRPVALNIVTHGHADHAHAGMGEYWSSVETSQIMRWRLGENNYKILNYGEKKKFGNVWVSLHPAGHVLGSAQVRVENENGDIWVFTGDFKREFDPTCKPFELIECDTFICEATFAYPIYAWPNISLEVARICDWVLECKEKKKCALIYAYSLGKAQRILAELIGKIKDPVLLHGAMRQGVQLYRDCGVALHETLPLLELEKNTDLAGRLVLAPPSAQNSAWTKRLGPYEHAMASGWMQLRGNKRRRNVQRGFVISDHVDWNALINTIRETKAQRVLATHGNTELLIPYLRENLQIDAQRLETEYGVGEEMEGDLNNE